MACAADTASELDVDTSSLPRNWERVEPDDLAFSEYSAWEHSVTELRVSVAQDRKPNQMADPLRSRDDVGYVARVRGDFGANLTHRLASREAAFEVVERFMHAFPNGTFEVPHPTKRPACEPVEWEGV